MCLNSRLPLKRTTSKLLQEKTRYELLLKKIQSYSHIRSFGCLVFVYDHNLSKIKFRTHSRARGFLGYPFVKKGFGGFMI